MKCYVIEIADGEDNCTETWVNARNESDAKRYAYRTHRAECGGAYAEIVSIEAYPADDDLPTAPHHAVKKEPPKPNGYEGNDVRVRAAKAGIW